MNKIKSALVDVLKRQFWMIFLVFTINVGINYWHDGKISMATCSVIMFGILLVILLYVAAETYWIGKKK
ncbi:MAG: hypothetical protein ABW069_14890 [Duganella sp.]